MHTLGDSPSPRISLLASSPHHITNDGLGPGVTPEARQVSLPESESLLPDEQRQSSASAASLHGREMQSRPAHASARKTTVEPSPEKFKPLHQQAMRSSTWYRGDGWALEIIAAICSLSCFVAIVAVLKVYDGQLSPSLRFGITLNAIISILSTTAKSSIMFGVTAAIGQAKWDRFSREDRYRRLLDLEHIDQASRGPLGSFRMLFTATGRSIASVGAIITLLMLAMDPFVQQILLYQQEPSAVSSESAWTEQVVAPTIFSNNSDPAYFGAINSALWNEKTSYERSAHCPTGNCTYPTYQSMGLCVASRDVPLDQISFDGNSCKMTYSNINTGQIVFGNMSGVLYANGNFGEQSDRCRVTFWGDRTASLPIKTLQEKFNAFGDIQADWKFPLDVAGSMVFDSSEEHSVLGFRNPLVALGRISWFSPSFVGNDSMSIQFNKAEQVAIAFCTNDYLTTVSQGITATSSTNLSSPTGFSYSDSTTVLGPNATCWTSGSEITSFPRAEIKQKNNGRYITTASPMSFCTDNWGWGVDIASRLTSDSYIGMVMTLNNNLTIQGWTFSGTVGMVNQDVLQQIQSRSLQEISKPITASLNALFRKYSSDRITGSFIEYQTVVHVQWVWLTLPVAVEILGFMFMLLMALRNPKSRGPWKGSILATLFHGLHPSGNVADRLETITSMEQEALKTMVKLEKSDGGKRFLRTRFDDTT